MEHIVLERHGDTALVYAPNSYERYVIAYHYDEEEASWGCGRYFYDLTEAVIVYRLHIATTMKEVREISRDIKALIEYHVSR